MSFVIRWNWSGGKVEDAPLVRDIGSNRKPYTTDINEAKKWKTKANAERYLSLKDPTWASNCVIEEI